MRSNLNVYIKDSSGKLLQLPINPDEIVVNHEIKNTTIETVRGYKVIPEKKTIKSITLSSILTDNDSDWNKNDYTVNDYITKLKSYHINGTYIYPVIPSENIAKIKMLVDKFDYNKQANGDVRYTMVLKQAES